ncbi:PREDICTED: cytochrome P450 4C1-like [Polistes dominula]|uniref:Cytochrome P450 4C1-like n=1 Tax=Polistes dominula TaxID=743375 RepID=A0ABM1I2M9_POLDO|nr:PREDICTED: cytochrome P450 4C1-like [Polistes dominula]
MKEKDSTIDTSLFLDTIFKSFYEGKEYTEQDIRDEINTIVTAGSDTSSISITFVLLMLAIYPNIQEQVYEELYQIYGSSDPVDENTSYQDTKNLKFLERVIKETFRLLTPVPFIARSVCEDIQVSEGVIVPKNSICILMLYALHRNEKYWKNPLQFNPDRFLSGNYNIKHFLPFGTGPRGCIGWNFAMTEIKVVVATVLRKFSVHVDVPLKLEDIAVQMGITMKPTKKIFLRFKKR